MKKCIIYLMIIFVISLVLTGCGSNNEELDSDNVNENDNQVSYTFEDLKTDLMALDSSTEVNQKSASLIGAEEGYGYIIGECSIEVYKYDKSSEQYKTAELNQQISMPSFDMTFDATVKNGYAYIQDGTCDNVIPYVEKIMK